MYILFIYTLYNYIYILVLLRYYSSKYNPTGYSVGAFTPHDDPDWLLWLLALIWCRSSKQIEVDLLAPIVYFVAYIIYIYTYMYIYICISYHIYKPVQHIKHDYRHLIMLVDAGRYPRHIPVVGLEMDMAQPLSNRFG
jgi:hypothetical protein